MISTLTKIIVTMIFVRNRAALLDTQQRASSVSYQAPHVLFSLLIFTYKHVGRLNLIDRAIPILLYLCTITLCLMQHIESRGLHLFMPFRSYFSEI